MRPHRVLTLLILSVALGTQIGGGCKSSGSSPAPSQGNNSDNYDRVPQSAVRLASGPGEIKAHTKFKGQMYVYDEDSDRVMFVKKVKDNAHITVTPDRNRVTIEGKSYDVELSRKHSHRIYVDRD